MADRSGDGDRGRRNSDGSSSDDDDGSLRAGGDSAGGGGGGGAAMAADIAEWDEWEDDPEEDDATKSLFSDAVLPSPEAAMRHDAERHGFDIRAFRAKLALDDYGTIKLVNYIRREVAAGRDPLPGLRDAAAAADKEGAAAGAGAAELWLRGEEYLAPSLPDDPLLGYDFDDDAADAGWAAATAAGTVGFADAGGDGNAGAGAAADGGLAALRAENAALRARLDAVAASALPAELLAEDLARLGGGGGGDDDDDGAAASTSAGPVPHGIVKGRGSGGTRVLPTAASASASASASATVDEAYFDSYSGFDIHREMLGDAARTEAYRAALEANPSLVRGARVLDVGCGTGVLSMFAARGGAAAVVGLDGSERIAGFARQNVAANGFGREQGGPVSVVAGRVEELASAGSSAGAEVEAFLGGVDGRADVLVSEWMGYALLFETMLDSVLAARDRWLRPGGAVLPDIATVFAAGGSDAALGLDFWEDVYGLRMSPIADDLRRGMAGKVLVREVAEAHLSTAAARVHSLDLATMKASDQDFTAAFSLSAPPPRAGGGGGGGRGGGGSDGATATTTATTATATTGATRVSCLVLWFDTEFSARFCRDKPVVLSTAPSAPMTHWMQAVLPLKAPVDVPAGHALSCRLSMARRLDKHRALDVSLEYGLVVAGQGGQAVDAAPIATTVETVLFCMEVSGE